MTQMCFTPEQCKAGRALLAMTRKELANLSGIKRSFIKEFEGFEFTTKPEDFTVFTQMLMAELIKQGCIFTNLSGVHLKNALEKQSFSPAITDLEQRYVDGKKVLPEHLSATDFERIGKHVSTDNFIFDEKARTAYVELELHNGAAASASQKSQVIGCYALGLDAMRHSLRAKAYLDAFFALKRSGHIA